MSFFFGVVWWFWVEGVELTCWIVGDLFPSSNILGVDLSPIQPEWVPPNVRFMVDDIE